jgi:phage tail-like protein
MVALSALRSSEAVVRDLSAVPREELDDILAPYLPALLRQDPFLSRFLRVFDAELQPIIEMIDAMDAHFDPALTPAPLLRWLAAWVGEGLDESQPEAVQRALISEAAELHRNRGTKAGLRRALELVAGRPVLVIENTAGFRLDEDARLGLNTFLEPFEPHSIQVTLLDPVPETELESLAEALRMLKPAHCTASVRAPEA